ncbi:MAG TPA: phosphoglucomutase [Bacteroidetes bacterium]|nr:phosphoglucomutase [Bacteroidota bacterium]
MSFFSKLDDATRQNIDTWLNGNYDQETKAQINHLIEKEDATALTDAFYKTLEFGTGGLRGIMGVGSNRINRYTIGAATQGFSNYLKKEYGDQQISVAIAFDCRNNATTFAKITADVFSANGIKVFMFPELRPTPQLSFAIRQLGCKGGVMLTASHNPKEYSGYKAYWNDGGQLVAPHDKNIVNEVLKIVDVNDIKFNGNDSLIEMLGEEMDRKYVSVLKDLSISTEAIKRQHDIKIVFSPIHGTGMPLVGDTLKAYGFTNVTYVEEQCTVDGNFPTVIYPNPEEHEALTMSIEKAREVGADLVMATDPDADRVGIAVRDLSGNFELLNGNQTGSLLMHYVLKAWKDAGKLTGSQYVVKTIVTSQLMDRIAESMNVPCYNVLTGFKFIGALMTEKEGKETFVVGGEESYGYLVGEHARDKDAVVAAAMIAEMAAYYKDQGKSLYEALLELYVELGFYKEKLISLTRSGKAGAEEIKAMMKSYRDDTPLKLGGSDVKLLRDYAQQTEKNLKTGKVVKIDLPKSDVLQFVTEDGSVISARPSGTEPKIKFYCSVNAPLGSTAEFEKVSKVLDEQIDDIMKDLGL